MPNDVKTFVSVLALLVAALLAFWKGSPVQPEFGTFVLITALFMVIAMWIFPEAGGKKRAPKS
jgi:membrane protein YdbS with pleckstrin-like domain